MVFDVVDLDAVDPDLVSFDEGSPPPLPTRPTRSFRTSPTTNGNNRNSELTARVLF